MGSRAKPALQVQGTLRPAWRQLEQLFASRDDLVDCLAGVQDPRIDQLLRLLADPQNAKTSLALLARQARVSLADFFDFLRAQENALAAHAAMARVNRHLPKVAEDAMVLGQVRKVPCATCQGKPETKATKDPSTGVEFPCSGCGGKGTVLVEPGLGRSKLALELGGLVKPKGVAIQVGVQNNQQVSLPAVPFSTSSEFRSMTDRELYPQLNSATSPTSSTSPPDEDDTEDAEVVEA